MSEEERGLKERITSAAGVITAAAAFITAAGSFVDSFPLKEFAKAFPAGWWCAIILTLLAGVCLFSKGRARSSRLIYPEAFSLKADNPRHLKGRDHDINTLSYLCEQCALVFLEGESGAGKSALLRSGLIPMLNAQGGLYPFLLDVWGEDWESGPMNGLAGGVLRSLSQADRKSLGLKNPPTFFETISILGSFRQTLGRTPILIFDQFDDYQILHRAKFLQGRSTWLTVNELCSSNRFWFQIRDLLRDSDIRCLFVTSADTSGGLGSVRFVTARTYRLDRLDSVFVCPLLEELVQGGADGRSVISNPGNGWDRLKERLAKDLTTDGVVLPVQLRTTLLAIGSLRELTVREYQKAGSLRGIEAEYIEDNVSRASRQSGLSKGQVRVLLTTLIDPEGMKTIPKSLSDLSTTATFSEGVTSSGDSASRCGAALEVLEQREILRRRSDLEAFQDVWLLYHDYLCRGVTAASRRANRWALLVEERFEQFRDASSLWGQWKSLLTPISQIVLLYQNCFGNYRYAKFRSYAALSLFRFLPYVALCLMLGFAVRLEMNLRAKKSAQAVLDNIGESDNLTPKEMQSLFELANADREIRRSFLVELLANPDAAERAYKKIDSIIIATTGLDPDGGARDYLFRELVKPSLSSEYSPEIGKLCVGFYARIAYNDIELDHLVAKQLMRIPVDAKEAGRVVARLGEVPAAEAARSLISFMTKASDVDNSLATPKTPFLAEVYCSLATRLSGAEAQEEAKELVSLMAKAEKARDYSELASLGKAFSGLASKADRATAEGAATSLIRTMGSTLDRLELDGLLEALRAICAQLDSEHSEEVAASIVRQMKEAAKLKKYYALSCQVKAFCAVPAARDLENSHSWSEMLLEAMQDPDIGSLDLSKLAEAFGIVASDGDSNAKTAAELLIGAMQKSEEDSFSVHGHWLAEPFARIAEKLDGPDAGVMAKNMLAYIERPEPRIKFIAPDLLGNVLPAIAGRLGAADALAVAVALASAIEKPESVLEVRSLAKAFCAVARKLDPKDAKEMAKRIIDTMEKQAESVDFPRQVAGLDIQTPSGDYGPLASLANAVSPMADKMESRDAKRLAVLLIGVMQKVGIDENALALLVEPFSNISKRVEADYSWQVVKLLMPYIQNAPAENPNSVEPSARITKAFCSIAEKLNAKSSQQTTELLVSEMERASNPYVLDSLARVLECLPEVESPGRLVEFLKVPYCVGSCRSSILRILDKYCGQRFEGDVWRFVSWVKASHRDREFDLSSPPNRVASHFEQSLRTSSY